MDLETECCKPEKETILETDLVVETIGSSPQNEMTVNEAEATHGDDVVKPKGFQGLKKWRRIKRGITKDGAGGGGVDFSRILKRGPSTVMEQMGSVAVVPIVFKGSTSDSRNGKGSYVQDSENSEDISSSKSTAASAPRERTATRDKTKWRNSGGKSVGNVRAQQRKGKKHRGGDRATTDEADNSYSSIESEVRSSKILFRGHASFSKTSNGVQRDGSSNYDRESSYEAQASDRQSSEEFQTDHFKDNGEEVEHISQDDEASWRSKEELSDTHRSSTVQDPIVESIASLQALQEALEKEIQMFAEIGKESSDSLHRLNLNAEFLFSESDINKPDSSGQLHSEQIETGNPLPLVAELNHINEEVDFLETKLEEALTVLHVKESRVVELEEMLPKSETTKEASTAIQLQQEEKLKEVELELECLFKQKVEAEIEYVVITGATQKLKRAIKEHISLIQDERPLDGGDQNEIQKILRDAESNIDVLKKQEDKLEFVGEELLNTKAALKIRRRLSKVGVCFALQVILVFLVSRGFILNVLPPSGDFVPT